MQIKNKTAVVLAGILVVLVVIGGFRNLRTGVYVGDAFLYERSSGYFKSGDDEIRMIKGDGFTNFQIVLDGETRNAGLVWSKSDELFGVEHDYATLTFDDGTVIKGTWFAGDTLVNEKGVPLIMANPMMVVGDSVRIISNEALGNVLCEMDLGMTEKNGTGAMIFMGAMVYVIGALTFLYPEKMYFMGSRWRYKNAELSEDGIWMERFGAVIGMIMGALIAVNVFGVM